MLKNVTYFDSFGVEHIPKEIRKFILNKNIITNIYRIQTCFNKVCTGFIDFMLKSKILLKYTNLFFRNKYNKSDKVILKYFQLELNELKCISMFLKTGR